VDQPVRHGAAAAALGRAVQVESMEPVLKPSRSMLLKLRYDGPLSSFAFNFNLRRYNRGGDAADTARFRPARFAEAGRCTLIPS